MDDKLSDRPTFPTQKSIDLLETIYSNSFSGTSKEILARRHEGVLWLPKNLAFYRLFPNENTDNNLIQEYPDVYFETSVVLYANDDSKFFISWFK